MNSISHLHHPHFIDYPPLLVVPFPDPPTLSRSAPLDIHVNTVNMSSLDVVVRPSPTAMDTTY